MSTAGWQDYERAAAELFSRLGLDAVRQEKLKGVRATHRVDVAVRFQRFGIDHLWIVECKHWQSSVGKAEVLTLRGVVDDVGADKGFLLSESGFQSGAVNSVRHTNIVLANIEDLDAAASDDLLREHLAAIARHTAAVKKRMQAQSHYTGFGRANPADGLEAPTVLEVHAEALLLSMDIERVMAGAAHADPTTPPGEQLLASIDDLTARTASLEGNVDSLADHVAEVREDAQAALEVVGERIGSLLDCELLIAGDESHAEAYVRQMRELETTASAIRAGCSIGRLEPLQRLMRHVLDDTYVRVIERRTTEQTVAQDREVLDRLVHDLLDTGD